MKMEESHLPQEQLNHILLTGRKLLSMKTISSQLLKWLCLKWHKNIVSNRLPKQITKAVWKGPLTFQPLPFHWFISQRTPSRYLLSLVPSWTNSILLRASSLDLVQTVRKANCWSWWGEQIDSNLVLIFPTHIDERTMDTAPLCLV